MECIVTDKVGYRMTLETSEKLKIIEPGTSEECFPFEDKLVFCYKKGSFQDCQAFINKQITDVQECLEIKNISDT
ncbi:MAG: hypothetical protein A3E21_05240 [Sulfurimonas sp. RIFCSPHIGHO2_12_FULL_36_9]|uniref:hypothetical protein n=1 Tax=Sulfurimonas sp. RIFCSPLOWO2_12_36_12 TaxID=1802253 RepID=UPI0008D8446E|nr:hypothetical protein [Sulfurimonas sp. RIFCSPLOWO2_12_36_12]OHD97744.1 MAG: hypothetical protein A3J26_06250 [Sulfurimonas sp. RIFCSPLOWO2_02_FULL_36_28]OHD99590.1 MAG: hypothetical protein A3E21_05240 [Sulfurimonas sp. RIFCSPHIGHO2_12_FULL_36_9]OHE00729.1 MAG: hypothetical protein A2W82_06745 [Sulfurimonas sp. RIFCSPLOWO2_12_36_12]OHE03167.1 MAG: hypothetical protein A3K14_09670 [Sulfurimonas sp. RIFCSPLOWO2_12_FULL_36_74]